MLRWVFIRGDQALTCEINAHTNRRSFVVRVLPHWNINDAASRLVTGPTNALTLHAQIASRLKESGWRVVSRG